jgi:Zn finger protein HypA/HybF involved in hydrogenase expression
MTKGKFLCGAKHTLYQPADEEFNCPRCGRKVGDFAIYEPTEGAHEDCPELHDKGVVECIGCGYSTTGRAFAKKLQDVAHQVMCPTCKGKGHVSGEPKNGGKK